MDVRGVGSAIYLAGAKYLPGLTLTYKSLVKN